MPLDALSPRGKTALLLLARLTQGGQDLLGPALQPIDTVGPPGQERDEIVDADAGGLQRSLTTPRAKPEAYTEPGWMVGASSSARSKSHCCIKVW